MASSVFYKFKASKNESRVNFDGTGITVFDLKKEIILANNLGKANDFDLAILDSSSNEGACAPPPPMCAGGSQACARRVQGRCAGHPALVLRRGEARAREARQGQDRDVPRGCRCARGALGCGAVRARQGRRRRRRRRRERVAPGQHLEALRRQGGAVWQRREGGAGTGACLRLCLCRWGGVAYAGAQVTIKPSTITQDDEAAAIGAMFQAQTMNWEETQEKMSQLVSRCALSVSCSTYRPNEHFCFFFRLFSAVTEPRVSIRTREAEDPAAVEASPSRRITSTAPCHRATCATDVDRKVCTCPTVTCHAR